MSSNTEETNIDNPELWVNGMSDVVINDFSDAHQKVIAQGEIETPKGRLQILSDGSYYYDNRTKEQMRDQAKEHMKNWDKENPEAAAAIDLRVDNDFKYRKQGIYQQIPNRNYLHNASYAERLAQAEALNGCKFKDSPAYTSKAWGEPMDRVLHDKNDGFANLCDGQIATMGRLNGFITYLCILQFFAVLMAPAIMVIDGLILEGIGLVLLAIGMQYFKRVVSRFDQFVFNRHTGLVKTPHNWWRRSFYIPFEDIECYDGGVVKSARGGGARATAKFRCMKTPMRYYLKTPEFIARFGGVDQGCWAGYLEFMDISKPINEQLHKSIEHYFTIDKNALETGPFPEVMKVYLDPEDKQVNRQEVW